MKKLDDILLKWLAEYTRQGLKGLKRLKNLEDSGAGEQIQGPNAGCVFVLHKYKESYLFVHVRTYPLQNYSDDVFNLFDVYLIIFRAPQFRIHASSQV